ncbi:MAG: hypothetical protein LQ351_003630 [Letrouitia transgressa]|nr:MAG: hypothetical protein LQ351_003630 [Letrouitia transgressa]
MAREVRSLPDFKIELGQITDKGRETTLALGERLRRLYVDQVGFMPKIISNSDVLYLRATPLSRAIDSVQQTFVGMYPATARTASFPPPTIVKREFIDEILFPNEGNCQRFRQLCRAFAQRAADRWNNSTDLDYINSLLSKWMPSSSPRVAVDSRPRLSGIMDTINSTLAHGVQTRLPSAFYDPKAQEIIDRIVVEEWFSGYKESAEYRKLGIGALLGDAVSRMVGSAEKGSSDGRLEVQGVEGDLGKGRDSETSIKLALNGCHDTTVAAILCSLGAFEGEKWPPYTSHVALELFRDSSVPLPPETPALRKSPKQPLFGSSSKTTETSHSMARKPLSEMNQDEKERLKCYYVRVRYNDRPIVVPGCRLLGKHWEGDESFCTLEAFKAIADKITPRSWTQACVENLDKPAFPAEAEPAGLE